jgi:superfamily II DNA or RNA helicase
MIVFNRTSGLCIPTTYKEEKFYQFIKEKLTRRFKNFNDPTYTICKFFIEGEKVLKIPRFFPVWDYVLCKVENKISDGEDIEINHKITLRDDLQKDTVNYMLSNDKGIIQASPGSGKTIMSIYVVAERKKKTIIICHRDSLVEQWIGPGTPDKPQGFLSHTDINPDEIGRLTSANFKKVLKKKIIVCTDQSFISLLKRNRQEFLIELNQANIGIFIGDEIHTAVGAPTFSECSLHIPAKVVFGLSATPKRKDSTNDILEAHLGKIFVPEGKSSTMDARVTVLLFDFNVIRGREKYMYWLGKFQRSRYLNLIKNSKMFLGVSMSLLEKFVNDGRQIIFMSERIKLIDKLFVLLKTEDKAIFIGGTKNDVLDKQVVFSTPGKIRDGVDIPKKDCLIMTSPIDNIDQMSGRIVRISKDKEEPLIVDCVDIGCPEIFKTIFPRMEFYNSKGWKVRYIYISSTGEKTEIDQIQVLKLSQGE